MLGQFIFKRPQHESERRAKFMTHVGKKRSLCTVDLRQRLSTLAFLLVRAGVGDRCGYAGSKLLIKIAVILVQRKPRAHADDDYSYRPFSAWRKDGTGQCHLRRFRIWSEGR